ncbi:unnamed protein product [Anisakis simplex]|uniref:TIMELESS-interacting protein n=1 Tax=Anisakis simplex TaxID=6269 RepID=A0A0M3IYK4_ANISI|nr:unnamed protein product [Anisakis simplex]
MNPSVLVTAIRRPIVNSCIIAEPPTDVHLLNDLLKEGDKRRVAPKTRVLRPQPKLREQELCGPRGIMSLKKMFDGYKPNPKKNPYEKLADVMNKIEYWAHLLHPKMKFEDVIDSIETLGGKRAVKVRLDMSIISSYRFQLISSLDILFGLFQTYMEKMRMDMPLTDEDFASISNPDGASPSKTREEGEEDATAAIEPSGTSAVVTNPPDEDYDDFIDDFYTEPSSSVNAFETPQTQNVSFQQSVELTEAQRERIAANKRRAEELRAKREAMLKQIEQGTSNEKHEDVQPPQTNLQTGSSTEETSQIVSTTEMSTDMMDDSDAMDYIFSTD